MHLIGPMSVERPYGSTEQRSPLLGMHCEPTSPRQAPTDTLRLASATSVGTQSRSQLRGRGGLFGQVATCTRQETKMGFVFAPRQSMLPEGDVKWIKRACAGAAATRPART